MHCNEVSRTIPILIAAPEDSGCLHTLRSVPLGSFSSRARPSSCWPNAGSVLPACASGWGSGCSYNTVDIIPEHGKRDRRPSHFWWLIRHTRPPHSCPMLPTLQSFGASFLGFQQTRPPPSSGLGSPPIHPRSRKPEIPPSFTVTESFSGGSPCFPCFSRGTDAPRGPRGHASDTGGHEELLRLGLPWGLPRQLLSLP